MDWGTIITGTVAAIVAGIFCCLGYVRNDPTKWGAVAAVAVTAVWWVSGRFMA